MRVDISHKFDLCQTVRNKRTDIFQVRAAHLLIWQELCHTRAMYIYVACRSTPNFKGWNFWFFSIHAKKNCSTNCFRTKNSLLTQISDTKFLAFTLQLTSQWHSSCRRGVRSIELGVADEWGTRHLRRPLSHANLLAHNVMKGLVWTRVEEKGARLIYSAPGLAARKVCQDAELRANLLTGSDRVIQ